MCWQVKKLDNIRISEYSEEFKIYTITIEYPRIMEYPREQ